MVILAVGGGTVSDKPTIRPKTDGPYLVTNCGRLQGLMDGQEYASQGTIALCRCGASQKKPFCDGSHNKVGFSGAKEPERAPDKRADYAGKQITIHDNRGICAHAGRCTDGLKSVFKLKQEPWIDPDGDTRENIIATIEKCPSGALSYSIDGVEHRDRKAEPVVLIAPNGPYVIQGGAEVQDIEFGEGASREHFDLCRCGKSTNKPFCSGAHWNHHFDEKVPPPE
jgi:CDGSH-type Zn-finger protein